jgi:ankyrin repeat protein
MNRLSLISLLLPVLFLFSACAAGSAPTPTLTPVPSDTPPPPTATQQPSPTATLSAEALQDAMFTAALEDDTAAMAQYISAGGDVNEKQDNASLLGIATYRANAGMVSLLLDAGATIDAQLFALAITRSEDDVEFVQLFIDHDADVNEAMKSNPAHTPLMFAAEEGFIKVGKLLVDQGADLNSEDNYGDPALNVAAFHGQMEFVKMLVDMGADLNVRGMYNRTAASHARKQGHDDVADYLISVGGVE